MTTNRLPSERWSRVAVALPGAIGAAVIARALGVYWNQDAVAALLMVVMGAGFLVGMAEVFLRHRRAFGLAREIDGLPLKPSEADLDRASPRLRGFLRARVEHAPMPSVQESVTPYLVGFLVMLGLFGTLLGLFETLHGAGQALTASADVDALRRGLSGPMRGLTRSFGCSAAGVSASAMLGLAAVFARRAEAAAWMRAQAYAMGPLRELSPMRRQLDAIGHLAQQGEGLPRAAASLEQAVAQLGGLAERWEQAHRSASEAQHKAMAELVQGLRGELTRSATDAGRTLSESMMPLIQQLITHAGEAAGQHMRATLSALDKDLAARRDGDRSLREALHGEMRVLREALDKDLAARREADLGLRASVREELSALREALDKDFGARLEADAQLRETLRGELGAVRDTLHDDLGARREADLSLRDAMRDELTTLREGLARDAQAHMQDGESRLSTIEASLRERVEQQAELLQLTRDQASQELAALASAARAVSGQLEEESQARREESTRVLGELAGRVEALSQRVGEDLGKLSAALHQDLSTRQERDRALTAHSESAMQGLTQCAAALEQALAGQEHAVQELIARGDVQLAQFAEANQQHAQEALARLVQLGEEQAARFAEIEAQIQGAQTQHVRALGDELTAHAERLGKGLEGTNTLIQEAANLLKASSVEMAAVAEMFHKSVERQREAASAWMESLGELEGAVERAGRGAAADALGDQLASTQEVFARQLQFQRELFEQLRTLRGAGANAAARGEQDVSA